MAVDEHDAGASGAAGASPGIGAADDSSAAVVWIGQGPRVEAVVVTDVSRPVLSGRTGWLDGPVIGLKARNGLAIAATRGWPDHLYTIDVRDHAAPRVLGATALTGLLGPLDMRDGFAYAVRSVRDTDDAGEPTYRPTVAIVDVRDPAVPVVVRDDLYGDDDWARDVHVVGTVLAVAVSSQTAPYGRRLDLYDIVRGDEPRLIASHPSQAVCRFGQRAGAARGHVMWVYGNGIEALDIADPSAVRTIQRWDGGRGDDRLCVSGSEGHLFIDGSGAPFVLRPGWTGGNALVAMANPPDGDGRRPSYWLDVARAPGAALVGAHVFLANMRGEVLAVDTRRLTIDPDTQARALSGRLELLGDVGALGVREDGEDGRIYAALREGGFRVLSLLQPLSPPIVGGVADPYKHMRIHIAGGVAAVSNDGGYDSDQQHADLYDLADPTRPRHLHEFKDGNFAHLLPRLSGTWVVTGALSRLRPLTDPLALAPIAVPDGPQQSSIAFDIDMTDVDTDGDALAAVGVEGRDAAVGSVRLDVWNVADPTQPRERGRLPNVARNTAHYDEPRVELSGRFAYVASAETADAYGRALTSRLTVVDIGTVAGGTGDDLRITGSLMVSGTITALAVADGFLFTRGDGMPPSGEGIGVDGGAIHVVDVRDAGAPRVIGRLPVGGYFTRDSMAVRDGRVYAAAGEAGVWVFEPPLAWRSPRSQTRLALPWLANNSIAPVH